MLLPIPLLALICTLASASQRPVPMQYDAYDYYVMHHEPAHALTPHDCADALGLELFQPLGELQDHWITRIRKGSHIDLQKRGMDQHLNGAIKSLELQTPYMMHKRASIPARAPPPFPQTAPEVASRLNVTDPLFSRQWHIINDEIPQHTLNVVPVWDMGYTGQGVTVAFIDDGVDFENGDFDDNFVC